jgi:hypothetical protein
MMIQLAISLSPIVSTEAAAEAAAAEGSYRSMRTMNRYLRDLKSLVLFLCVFITSFLPPFPLLS